MVSFLPVTSFKASLAAFLGSVVAVTAPLGYDVMSNKTTQDVFLNSINKEKRKRFRTLSIFGSDSDV